MRRPVLSPAQRQEIKRRLAAGEKVRPLAAEFGVSVGTISKLNEQTGHIGMGNFRSRIVGEGEEAPDQLLANPLNWSPTRTLQHPPEA